MGLKSGRTIREYEVLGLIRENTHYGNLYAARHKLLSTPCAIREISENLIKDRSAREWMLKEAKVFSAFNHPSVARLLQCFEEDNRLYLIYDFIDGMVLSSILKRGPLPPSQAVKIALVIGSALKSAHEIQWNLGETAGFGIPHGNLTGDVIVVGGDDSIKIFDFSPLGSVSDTGCDRHALGCLLAKMLTGETLWNEDDYGANLPPLPATLRDLIDTLFLAQGHLAAMEFTEFLPQLEEISLAYEEGGLVPRRAIDLSIEMKCPLPITCHGARKRIYIGDSANSRVAKYDLNGELEQIYDDLGSKANGLVFMAGYGLFVFGASRGDVSFISPSGQVPLTIKGYESIASDSENPSSFEEFIVGAARVNRGLFALADRSKHQLLLVDAVGSVMTVVGAEDGIKFSSIGAVACNKSMIAVVDDRECNVIFFDLEGKKLKYYDLSEYGIEAPSGCELDDAGNFYVLDKMEGKLVIIEHDGGMLEFDSLVIDAFVSLSPGDLGLAENSSIIMISDPLEKVLLMFDNYFYLSALEQRGGCNVCGFINPDGVGQCLACQALEKVFPAPDDSLENDEPAANMAELENDLMYQSMIEAGEVSQVVGPLIRRLEDEPDNEEVLMLLGAAFVAEPLVEPSYGMKLLGNIENKNALARSSAYILCSISVGFGSKDCSKKFLKSFILFGGDEEQINELQDCISHIKDKFVSDGIPFFSALAALCESEQLLDFSLLFHKWLFKINPEDYGTRASLGRLCLREHDFKNAREHFEWMVTHNSYDVEALEVLTCMFNQQEKWNETFELLNKFFEDPRIAGKLVAGHGKLRYNYSICLRNLGKKNEAKREHSRSKRLGFSPLSAETIKSFFAYHKNKDYKNVVKVGDELCLDFEFFKWPDGDISRSLVWKIAGAYEKQGDYFRSMRTYRMFIRNFPGHPASTQADRTVASLALKLKDIG